MWLLYTWKDSEAFFVSFDYLSIRLSRDFCCQTNSNEETMSKKSNI
jgi:hypothetical protein